jgi:hypothetical protein
MLGSGPRPADRLPQLRQSADFPFKEPTLPLVRFTPPGGTTTNPGPLIFCVLDMDCTIPEGSSDNLGTYVDHEKFSALHSAVGDDGRETGK